MNWGPLDFLVAGGLLAAVAGGVTLVLRKAPSVVYAGAATLALLTGLAVIWSTLAVGIIGSSANDANAMMLAIPSGALIGALLSRGHAPEMAKVMFGAAALQGVAGAIALVFELGEGAAAWPNDVLIATAVFASAWLASACLFRLSGSKQALAA